MPVTWRCATAGQSCRTMSARRSKPARKERGRRKTQILSRQFPFHQLRPSSHPWPIIHLLIRLLTYNPSTVCACDCTSTDPTPNPSASGASPEALTQATAPLLASPCISSTNAAHKHTRQKHRATRLHLPEARLTGPPRSGLQLAPTMG